MKKIAILFPSDSEMAPFLPLFHQEGELIRSNLKHRFGRFANLSLVLVKCGIGKANTAMATQQLIDLEKPDAVLMCGVSGGIRAGLHIGDTVLGKLAVNHDLKPAIVIEDNDFADYWFQGDDRLIKGFLSVHPEEVGGKIVAGKIATGEQFIDQEGRTAIVEAFDPDCVDMETAAAAQVCTANAMPFCSIRTITDTEEESGIHTFHENFERASAISCKVLAKGLEILAK